MPVTSPKQCGTDHVHKVKFRPVSDSGIKIALSYVLMRPVYEMQKGS